jgi:pimeloyl-ACP methyl ester carboxylesterase
MRTIAAILMCAVAGCQAMSAEERAAYDRLPPVEVSGPESSATVRLKTRPWVVLGFTLNRPPDARAVALYFPGGDGRGAGFGLGDELARRSVAVATMAPPTDRPGGFSPAGDRSASDHVADADAAIRYLRRKIARPVWVVGLSMGSVSVANVALNGTERVDGAVFLSSITERLANGQRPFGETLVTEFPLDRLKAPVLAVAHKRDRCRSTPPEGAEAIVRQAANAPVKEAALLDGGTDTSPDPCAGASYHTFAGIRRDLAEEIARFILANSKPAPGS